MKKIIFIVSILLCGITVLKAQNCIDTLIWKVSQQYFGILCTTGTPLNGYTRTYFKNTPTKDDYVRYSFCVHYFGHRTERFEPNTETLRIGRRLEFLFNGVWTEIQGETFLNGNLLYGYSHEENEYEVGFGWMMCFACRVDDDGFSLPAEFRMIAYIDSSSMDGKFCDSIVKLSADTAYYTIIDGEVSIDRIDIIGQDYISIFPNPAQSQLTVINTQDAILRLYNVLGQEVVNIRSEGENAIINTSHLPQGLYVLKVEKENAILTRKIHITR